MTCEIRMRRKGVTQPCGRSAKLYRVVYRGHSLGDYQLCPNHCSKICRKPVDLVRLDGRTRREKFPKGKAA
jgi:hypothetical protein